MMDRTPLLNAVNSKLENVYMTNYSQIKDYYQDKHGQKGWIGAMAQALSGSTSRSKSDKPYQAARRAVERFETGQNKSMKKYGGKVESVGRTLPPIGTRVKGNEMTVTVKGVQYEKGGRREREWTATFTGPDAYNFASNPTYRKFFKQLGYPDGVIDRLEGGDSSAVDVMGAA